jgi:hypothetical protein
MGLRVVIIEMINLEKIAVLQEGQYGVNILLVRIAF